jgi:hypothetical protein
LKALTFHFYLPNNKELSDFLFSAKKGFKQCGL